MTKMTMTPTGTPEEEPPRSTRLYGRLARWSAGTVIGRSTISVWQRSGKTHVTTYRQVILLGSAAIVAAVMIWNGFQSQSDARVNQAIDAGFARQYDAEVVAYNLAQLTYNACLTDVARLVDSRNKARETLFAIVDLSDLYPEGTTLSADVQRYIDTRRATIEEKQPVLSAEVLQATCEKPGPVPIDPSPSK